MALFTDGPISSTEDLTAQDSQLLAVASTEGIDVTVKLGLAQDEVALEINALLTRMSYVDQLFWVVPQPTIANVVVTPALKLWHTYHTLELIYADAFSNQMNDRYAGKRDQFRTRAGWAYEQLIQTGIGIVANPIPRSSPPMATMAAVQQPGVPLPDGTYFVSVAWTNDRGEEGSCSEPTTVDTLFSTFLVTPGSPPGGPSGWNVYVGTAPDGLSLQNSAPIGTSQTWLQRSPLSLGRAPSAGQTPSYFKQVPRMLQRG